MMWFDDQIPSDQLSWDNIELQIQDLEIKDPVLVDIITGRVYDVNKQTYRNVGGDLKLRNFPIWDSPMLLIERDSLSWKKLA